MLSYLHHVFCNYQFCWRPKMLKLSAHRYLVQFEMPGEHLLETHTPLD